MSAALTPQILVLSILRGIRDPEWHRVTGDEERAWIVVMSICEELHPFGPVILPPRAAAEEHLVRAVRDRSIWEEFDGRNYAELAAKHNLEPRTVRTIVERMRRQAAGG